MFRIALVIIASFTPFHSSEAQQYFKASYLDTEGTGDYKGWDQSGYEFFFGKKSPISDGKGFIDLGGALSWTSEEYSASGSATINGLSVSGSGNVEADVLSLTFHPSLGYNLTDKISLYAGPNLGVGYRQYDIAGSVTVDGTTYSGSESDDEFGFNYGYGIGLTVKFSDRLGLDLGWKEIKHHDVKPWGHDLGNYEGQYWHYGLFYEF